MISVRASELQKNFGEWHDRAYEGPVEITRYGRTTAYLVSAKTFEEMWASFRRALPVSALSQEEIDLISSSKVETDRPFSLDDIPDDPSGASR
jgi:prevent-host-death family protein